MFDVILGLVAGILLILIVPALLPARFNNITIANAVRGLGVLVILFSVGLTSFVHVPDGHLGELFRVYGGRLAARAARSSPSTARTGRRPSILTPGFHF